MKIRIFKRMVDGVFEVRVQTEDWSEGDKGLMVKYGEPEINLGGMFSYVPYEEPSGSSSSSGSSSGPEEELTIDDYYVRIMTESPFVHKFDSRDLHNMETAQAVAAMWSDTIERRIVNAVKELREKGTFFTTEEIMEY